VGVEAHAEEPGSDNRDAMELSAGAGYGLLFPLLLQESAPLGAPTFGAQVAKRFDNDWHIALRYHHMQNMRASMVPLLQRIDAAGGYRARFGDVQLQGSLGLSVVGLSTGTGDQRYLRPLPSVTGTGRVTWEPFEALAVGLEVAATAGFSAAGLFIAELRLAERR
ncbi:MAG: hypothetical protein ACOCV2_14165, partial [Persicimonas sp.]